MRTTCDQNMSSIWSSLLELELFPPKPPKMGPIGFWTEKMYLFLLGKVDNSKNLDAKTWHLDEYSYYRLSENLWWHLEVGPGDILEPISTPLPPP